MNNVLIIGCGGIGSRHLQGLSKSNIDIEITVCDPNEESIAISRARFSEMPDNPKIKSLTFVRSIHELSQNFDIAIIATTSDKREILIRDLLGKISIKYFIIEKIAFQSVAIFQLILELFKRENIKAWVNCPNRAFNSYRRIKKLGLSKSKVFLSVDGGNWGLASNLIHYIDLFSFFTSETNIEISSHNLDNNIYRSKRREFIELSGSITARTGKGDQLVVNCEKNSDRPIILELCYEDLRVIISESESKAKLQTQKKKWVWEDLDFEIENQSSMTNNLIYQILRTGSCDLTRLEESYQLHKIIIKSFCEHISSIKGREIDLCPIT